MKTKKFFLQLLSVALMAVASPFLAACGDDDNNEDNATNAETNFALGQWSISDTADEDGTYYNFTGTMQLSKSWLTINFHEEGSTDHAAVLGQACRFSDATIEWYYSWNDHVFATFDYQLSDDHNTITMTGTRGGIDGWHIHTLRGTRVTDKQ